MKSRGFPCALPMKIYGLHKISWRKFIAPRKKIFQCISEIFMLIENLMKIELIRNSYQFGRKVIVR